jgi:hypothetical protein
LRLKRQLISAKFIEKNIFEAKNLKTPFVLGLIRPKIYLPVGLNVEERSYILLHEQTHIHRKDHIFKALAFLILAIHWFNPLVWIAFMLMSLDMELSCDERVLKEIDEEIKKPYANSLLSLAAGRHILNGSPLAFGEGNIKGRIKNVLNYKKPRFWVIAVSIIIVTAVGIGLMVNPKVNRVDESERITDSTQQGNNLISPQMTIEPTAPDLSLEQGLGVDMPELDYASDDIVIFHGYFGLCVYDLNTLQIIRSIDLKPLNCHQTQGSNACDVSVSVDGNTVQLHPMESKNMYIYTVSNHALQEVPYQRMEESFSSVPIKDVIDSTILGNYSYNAARFDTGEYGYLQTSDWTLGTLSYVRGDMLFGLFDKKESKAQPTTNYSNSVDSIRFQETVWQFAKAYFSSDKNEIKKYLADGVEPEVFKENAYDKLSRLILKWNPEELSKDKIMDVQYEFLFKGEDSCTYLGIVLKYQNEKWLVQEYYLEK